MTAFSVTDGLVVRLVASAGVSTSGSTVLSWENQAGAGGTLSATGAPQVTTLNSQPAITFDGIGDFLTGAIAGLPSGNAPRSMFAVVKYDSVGPGGVTWGNNAANQAFGLAVDSNGFLMIQRWHGDFDQSSSNAGDGTNWMLQGVRWGGGGWIHYRDGLAIDGGGGNLNTAADTALRIGAELDGAPLVAMEIAEVLVYDRVITESEMRQIGAYAFYTYAVGNLITANPVPTPVGHWKASYGVSESAGAVQSWPDLSGNGGTLTAISGAPAFVPNGLNGSPVISLDGVDDSLGSATVAGLPTGNTDRTIFAVMRFDSAGVGGFSWGAAGSNQTFGLCVATNGNYMVQRWGTFDRTSGTLANGDGWHSISTAFDVDATWRLYRDGVSIFGTDTGQTLATNAAGTIRVGVEIDNTPFVNMQIAEVVVYDRFLTQNERELVGSYLRSEWGVGFAGSGTVAATATAVVTTPTTGAAQGIDEGEATAGTAAETTPATGAASSVTVVQVVAAVTAADAGAISADASQVIAGDQTGPESGEASAVIGSVVATAEAAEVEPDTGAPLARAAVQATGVLGQVANGALSAIADGEAATAASVPAAGDTSVVASEQADGAPAQPETGVIDALASTEGIASSTDPGQGGISVTAAANSTGSAVEPEAGAQNAVALQSGSSASQVESGALSALVSVEGAPSTGTPAVGDAGIRVSMVAGAASTVEASGSASVEGAQQGGSQLVEPVSGLALAVPKESATAMVASSNPSTGTALDRAAQQGGASATGAATGALAAVAVLVAEESATEPNASTSALASQVGTAFAAAVAAGEASTTGIVASAGEAAAPSHGGGRQAAEQLSTASETSGAHGVVSVQSTAESVATSADPVSGALLAVAVVQGASHAAEATAGTLRWAAAQSGDDSRALPESGAATRVQWFTALAAATQLITGAPALTAHANSTQGKTEPVARLLLALPRYRNATTTVITDLESDQHVEPWQHVIRASEQAPSVRLALRGQPDTGWDGAAASAIITDLEGQVIAGLGGVTTVEHGASHLTIRHDFGDSDAATLGQGAFRLWLYLSTANVAYRLPRAKPIDLVVY